MTPRIRAKCKAKRVARLKLRCAYNTHISKLWISWMKGGLFRSTLSTSFYLEGVYLVIFTSFFRFSSFLGGREPSLVGRVPDSLMVRRYEPGRENHEFNPRLGNFFLWVWKVSTWCLKEVVHAYTLNTSYMTPSELVVSNWYLRSSHGSVKWKHLPWSCNLRFPVC